MSALPPKKQTWFNTLIRCDHFGVRQLPRLVDSGFSNWIVSELLRVTRIALM
jgi:hypothetical protein